MSRPPQDLSQVVVTFDPLAPAPMALQVALRVVAAEATRLHALYVEDRDALALSAFPWATEITLGTAEARPLVTHAVERAYASGRASARALFDAAAGSMANARFETVRGRLADELVRLGDRAAGILVDWPRGDHRPGYGAARLIRTLLGLQVPYVGLIDPRSAGTATLVIPGQTPPSGAVRSLIEAVASPSGVRTVQLHSPATTQSIIALARVQRAGTLLIQRSAVAGDEDLLARLALKWVGSFLVYR